ncbi:MAG TPA: PQQ-binding-like beta-propeller repeat protein, partial [Ktedonobacterales bacterium]|nr:PQQ-binding-like beta-propeller repeat protein [Ktedonobacterales bacterium]
MRILSRRVWTGTGVAMAAAAVVILAGALSAALSLRPGAASAGLPSNSRTATASQGDWSQYRYDVFGTGVNPAGGISLANAAQLQSRWTATTGPFVAGAAIVGDVVYAPKGAGLAAYNLHTGQQLWYFSDLPNHYGGVFSAVSVDAATHSAYYGTPDGFVYAVDISTGQGLWHTQLGDPAHGAFIWDAPLLVNGKVYIGLASQEDSPCVRSAVFALDPRTGAIEWTHYTAPAGTLGGGVWSSLTANPALHDVIATTGNPCPIGPTQDDEDAIVALDWNTGALDWRYTVIARDNCDCDFGEGAVSYTYGGQSYIVAGNKDGIIYALALSPSGTSVKLAWSTRISGAGYLGSAGIYQPPTYSDGLVFVAGGPTTDGACVGGALWALQAQTGAPVWRQCTSSQVVSAGAISGGVLFVAQRNVIVGYDTRNGQVVWHAAYTGDVYGGIALARGFLIVPTLASGLRC